MAMKERQLTKVGGALMALAAIVSLAPLLAIIVPFWSASDTAPSPRTMVQAGTAFMALSTTVMALLCVKGMTAAYSWIKSTCRRGWEIETGVIFPHTYKN